MRNLQIKNSFNIWNTKTMKTMIDNRVKKVAKHYTGTAEDYLNRSYLSMYIEWYVHNVFYYLTLPFKKFKKVNEINQRAKHVDLEEFID